jgi:hypothetical protein
VSRTRWGALGALPPGDTASGKSRGPRRVGVVGALALLTAVLGGAAGIAAAAGSGGTHPARLGLGLACRFPSGTYPVSAVIEASFPDSTVAGGQIRPAGVRVSLRLPQTITASLRKAGASTVSASGSLAVTRSTGGSASLARWPLRAATASQLPATGSLQIAAAGRPAAVAASAAGTVTFAASGLDLTLSPRTAAGSAASPGTVLAACAPERGASTLLASVVVSQASASPGSAASQPAKAAKHKGKIPKGCGHIKVVGSGIANCAYITGYSNVRKLYGAALLQPAPPMKPGLINVDLGYKTVLEPTKIIAYSKGQLYWAGHYPTSLHYDGHEGLPPVRSTFLTFRFMPVTATLVLLENGPINIVSVSGKSPPYPITVTTTTRVSIHVYDVSVNGKPLDVGWSCQSKKPAPLKLIGHGTNAGPTGYTVSTGGPLAGFLRIPSFVHCGVTENLDPLLTGTISGPRNYVKVTQGKLCAPKQPTTTTCPPPVPKPIR